MLSVTMRDSSAPPDARADFDLGSFPCPRCGATAAAEYYGPCDSCRDQLRAAYAGEQREVESAAYEPKMNVTPNAVALKD